MTTMVLGAVGAVAGGIVGSLFGATVLGAQLGFMLGSMAGSLIDPPKNQGPKLNDLKLQDSVYGKMIPFVWGTGRLAGNLIDKTDLQPTTSGGGGKGGPDIEETTYSASLDILLCARTPGNTQAIQGIKRIWADAREIWSDSSGENIPCTIYFGSEDQAVDPTFEAIHGVGNVPAYNNYAHVVFTDFQLKEFSNRPPNFEFEVYTKAGIFPWRVSTFEIDNTGFQLSADAAIYEEGIITVGWGWRPSWAPVRYQGQYLLDGTVVTPIAEVSGGDGGVFGDISAHNGLTFFDGIYPGGGSTTAIDMVYPSASTHLFYLNKGGSVWAVVSPSGDSVTIRNDPSAFTSLFQFGTTNVWDQITDDTIEYKIYVCDRNDAGSGNFWLHELLYTVGPIDTTLTLNRTWDLYSHHVVQPIFNGASFVVYRNRAGRLVLACDRGLAGFKQVYCYYLNDDLTATAIGGVNYGAYGQTHPVTLLGQGPYVLLGDGVISLEPPSGAVLLSEIVGDLSTDFVDGTALVAHDVAELTDEVRWFAVANVMTRRNAIGVLRPAFFFDAVESDDEVVFRKRGSSSIATIPDADLCGRSEGEDAGDPLRTIRRKEQGLPRVVTMTYYDVDMDYQTGAQSSPRVTTLSESEVIVEVPIGFTASEALQKCWTIQCSEWIEREQFEWSTTRKWARLEPCDVVNVRGRVIRITARTEKPDGVVHFGGVLEAPSIYTQNAASNVGGFTEQPTLSAPVLTELVLLDIPVLSQSDSPFGFRAAMGRASAGRWSGATLYKSLDGGTDYKAIASTSMPAIIGHTATSAVGSPSVTGALSAYGGGDVVEEVEICVVLHDERATLSSITATALSNGGGWCAISRGYSVGSPTVLEWEILGIRDWTLIGASTYVGRGFKRGRKNTLTTNHADGDIFVLLSTTINVDAPVEELNLSLKYKAVTFGKTLASAEPQDFINTGQSTDSFYGEEIIHLPPFTGASGGSPSVGGSQGVVPAPAPGDCEAGKYLSACGIWSVPPTGSGGGGSGGYVNGPNDWMFGAGIDGTAILDGTNTFAWASKVGNVYTLSQIVSFTNLTISASVTLQTNSFVIWVKDTLQNDGTISSAGASAVASVGGLGGGATNGIWARGATGASGGIGNGANGAGYAGPSTGGGGVGGAGGAGGATTGGSAGVIAFPTGPGGFTPTATFGQIGLFFVAAQAELYALLGSTIGGGSGGGAGGGTNPQNGGGAGGGGGPVIIFARLIVGSGTITSRGGDGASATGGNSGGGGGGGGGLMYIVTSSANYATLNTVTVAGGTPGTGFGTGVAGQPGNAGRLIEFLV